MTLTLAASPVSPNKAAKTGRVQSPATAAAVAAATAAKNRVPVEIGTSLHSIVPACGLALKAALAFENEC
eukprot:1788918-Alexandrium_andersonii.AAC.1